MRDDMPAKSTSFIKLMSKKIIVMITLICLLMLFLMMIIFFMNQSSKDEYILIDVFGRQRMLTQQLSKDANRKYAILQSLQNGSLIETDEALNEKTLLLNNYLAKAHNEFSNTLSSLRTGYLEKDDISINLENSIDEMGSIIEITDDAWDGFSQAVREVIGSKQADKQTAEALIYINKHEEQLLQYSDEITQGLINLHKKNANRIIMIAFGLFTALLISLLILVFQLYKYIVIPLNELYIGINNIGSLKKNTGISIPIKNELTPVIKEVDKAFNKLSKLIELIENINHDTSFEGILKYIYTSFSEFIPYSHIGIALLKDNGESVEASYGISDPALDDLPKKLMGIKARLDETSLKGIVTKGIPRVINDLEEYTKNSHALYNKILLESGIRASITLPLKLNNKPVGIIFFSSTVKNTYKQHHIAFLETLSSSIAISLNKNIFIDELLYSTVLALAKMAESRDEDTGDHLDRMKKYAARITEFLLEDNVYSDEISVSFIKEIERFSPMHDIGKVAIRDGILLKPGRLTPEEFDDMKKHTIYGAEVLRTAEENMAKQNRGLFKIGIEIAEGHHEKWDGTGYPYSKSGSDIPLSARIVAVADVFDALTSKRPYKEAFSFEQSFNMIVEGKGKHFDPYLIDSFIKHKGEIFEVYNNFRNIDQK